jgi:type III pantothenate kinase
VLTAMDIGNSSVHVGIGPPDGMSWNAILRFSSDVRRTSSEWYAELAPHLSRSVSSAEKVGFICCSVVPFITPVIAEMTATYFGSPLTTVTSESPLDIVVATERPAETGTDRVVNANAAAVAYGVPVIVVDVGTATKVDVVSGDRRFLGGAIAPGLQLGMDALVDHAAQLYSVPLELPVRSIGTNTVEAVQAGLVIGHIEMIEGLVRRAKDAVGSEAPVVLTGGFSGLVSPALPSVTHIAPMLTLDGLRHIDRRSCDTSISSPAD